MTGYSVANRSLKNRVQARLTHLDLGTYDLDWLDSRKVPEIQSQLQWLDDAAAECRVDGDLDSAEAYEEVLEAIQIESQLARAEAMPPLHGIDPHGPLLPGDYPSDLWRRIDTEADAMRSYLERIAQLERSVRGGNDD